MSESVPLEANDSVPQDESSYAAQVVEVRETANVTGLQGSALETPGISAATTTPEQKGMTLKGMLMMAVCCGAPLLLLAAVGLFGVSLAGAGGSLLNVAALLACPIGMYLMMKMMTKEKKKKLVTFVPEKRRRL